MPDYALIFKELKAALPELDVLENEPMRLHCSFKIGGPARIMLMPGTAVEAAEALKILRSHGARVLIMGNGTNLLIPDEGYSGAVVCMSKPMSELSSPGPRLVRAGAGATLAATAVFAAQNSLSGLEFAHGIPGSVGGGVAMNAGAYGGELKDVLESVEFIDGAGNLKSLPACELGFSYRRSAFSDSDWLITGAVFKLAPGNESEIRGKMRELIEKRRASQPLDLPSAGSTFKRPAGGYAAAMIDQAGLKGFAVGGAMVSPKHAGFVVNTGEATYSDVVTLMRIIRERVHEREGVWLEPEVKIMGEGLS